MTTANAPQQDRRLRVMTLEEVSKYLRLSKSTVNRMANEGRIPVSKIGRRWRFRKDVIDEWLSEQEKM